MLLQACDGGPTGPRTGSLTVNIASLPTDIAAAVTVEGEVGTPAITVGATRTLADLEPGTYTVTAAKVVGAKATYNPATPSQIVEVPASTSPTAVTVAYTLITGIVNVSITGLPAGADAAATVFNSSGFFANFKTSGEVGNLEPGTYTLQLDPISSDEIYAGSPIHTTFTVAASPTPVQVQGTYAATTGSIQLSASGLPQGAVPVWDVTGPNGAVSVVRGDGSTTISRLAPATYSVTARTFDFANETWGSASPTQSIAVAAGTKAPVAFAYITRPATLNLTVEGAYVTQSSQRFNGSVPLIANRAGFLRVFVKANEANLATPKVRARFYRNGQLLTTATLEPGAQSVGTVINEKNLVESWGVSIPPEMITGGFSFAVEVDPDNAVRESNESDNIYPSAGAQALDVRAVPATEIRFVPIAMSVSGTVGNVTEERLTDLVGLTMRMFPVGTSSVDVRAPFTTNAAVLQSNDGNGSWIQIINELNTLRIAEGTQRHYVGILKTPYSSGVAGLGFVPGKTVLSWDAPSAASTVAHELGHNWGRNHAPCGGPAGVDQNFPYPNARIGVFGFDVVSRTVMDSERRDVMSYCGPEWVSDYTYEGVLNFRGSSAASVSSQVQSSLMLWGRMDAGKLVLEPAFLADTRPSLPARSGSYRVEGFDASGATVFSLSFEPERVGHENDGDVRQFGFAVPMSPATAARLVSIKLSGNGREVRVDAAAPPDAPGIAASAISSEKIRLTWNSSQFPLLVVRDPDTREILAFARGGTADVRTRKRSLQVAASNRVASTRLEIQTRN